MNPPMNVLPTVVMLLAAVVNVNFLYATPQTLPKADISKFKLEGDPPSSKGATWTYESKDDGVVYKLNGTLFKPAGKGPFPAVLINHGLQSSANVYGAKISKEMVKWGLVCIAPNYTYGDKKYADGAPGAAEPRRLNKEDNLQRAHKCFDILQALGCVDMKRLATHGHSKGAFLNVAIAGTFSDEFKAASHTAGGVEPTIKELALKIKAPYSIHHGDADTSVRIGFDERFEATLTQNKVEHEFHVYPGFIHNQTATNETVLARVKAWYLKHGVLSRN